MRKSLWMLGKKIFFALVFVSFGFANSSFAALVEFGDSLRIKNLRTGYYLTVVGSYIFARKEASPESVFKVVADYQNVAARTGQDVKMGEDVYLMSGDLVVGKFGGEYMIYAGIRRLLGVGRDKINISVFRILPGAKEKAVSNFVPYGNVIRLQSGGDEIVRTNVDISTHPKGREVFFGREKDARMTPLALDWTGDYALEFVSRPGEAQVPAAGPKVAQPAGIMVTPAVRSLPPSDLKPILIKPAK